MSDIPIVRYCYGDADSQYVGKVAAFLSLGSLNHWQSIFIRRCIHDGLNPRQCARSMWQMMNAPYTPEVPF